MTTAQPNRDNTAIDSKLQVYKTGTNPLPLPVRHSERFQLLEILAIDGLCSVAGLARTHPHLVGILRGLVRQRLARVARLGLKPTGYSRQMIPTDIAVLTATGRLEAQRTLGRFAVSASLEHEVEHRVGVAEFRTHLQVPPDAWISPREGMGAWIPHARGPGLRVFPDALASISGLRLAFEYDHGRYTEIQVREKLHAFKQWASAAVWAAPTERRIRWLQGIGCEEALVLPLPLGLWRVESTAECGELECR